MTRLGGELGRGCGGGGGGINLLAVEPTFCFFFFHEKRFVKFCKEM